MKIVHDLQVIDCCNDVAILGAIAWTGRGLEFNLIEPEEVSQF